MSDETPPLIVVEDPPITHPSQIHNHEKWSRILAQVKAAGNVWCRVDERKSHHQVSSTMDWLKKTKRFGPYFRFCTRSVTLETEKVYRIYARYIGE